MATASDRYQPDIVRSIYGDTYSSLMPSLALGYVLLSAFFHDSAFLKEPMDTWWLISAVSYGVNFTVVALWIALHQKPRINYGLWAKRYDAISFITGLSHGYFCTLLDISDESIAMVYLSFILAVSIGSSVSSGLRPSANVCYFTPLYLMAAANFWQSAFFTEFLISAFLSLLLSASFSYKAIRMLKKSIDLRYENLELIEELQEQKFREAQASLDKSRFISAASHDLRQPLQSATFLVAALQNNNPQAEHLGLLEKVSFSLKALSQLLESLMDISVMDSGQSPLNPGMLHLCNMVETEVALFRTQAREKGIVVNCQFDQEMLVYLDPTAVRRIVSNLLDNAIKYTKSGQITIGICQAEEWVHIEVRDTGIGISQEYQAQIFKEFFQVDNPERDRRKGVGLGLSIVKRLVHQLQGEIKLESSVGVGTRVTVSLPRMNCPSVGMAENSLQKDPECTLRDCRVLVVDDDIDVRESLQLLLESWGVYASTTGSISEALTLIDQGVTLDMLLVDYRLRAGETGLLAIDVVREALKKPLLPALIITGDTESKELQALENSGNRYLAKPVGASELKGELVRMKLGLMATSVDFQLV